MHARQPIQAAPFRSTMPSRRLKSAFVGQIFMHGASSHWLQRTGRKNRCVSGKRPFSTVLTQHRFSPTGMSCSDLHAIVHAWQPMHFFRSMTKP
jgi:hypothetical protein